MCQRKYTQETYLEVINFLINFFDRTRVILYLDCTDRSLLGNV